MELIKGKLPWGNSKQFSVAEEEQDTKLAWLDERQKEGRHLDFRARSQMSLFSETGGGSISIGLPVSVGKDPKDTSLVVNYGWQNKNTCSFLFCTLQIFQKI